MKKFLFSAICLLSLQFSTHSAFAQIPISGTDWTGSGPSTTTATDPSTFFTTVPASFIPGSFAVNVSQWNRNNLGGVLTALLCYNSDNWTSGGSLASAQADAKYIYFTITNDANTELEITSLNLVTQTSSTGPDNVQLCYAIGAGPDVIFGPAASTPTSGSPITVNMSGIAHICAGQTATFKLYGWRVSASPAYTAAGTLRINDNTGITADFVQPPVVTFATSSSPVCSGNPLDFFSNPFNGIAPYTYSWTGPASYSSTLANPTILTPSVSATGTYTLTVADAYNCTSTATTDVTVDPTPDTTMTISGPLTFCTPGSVTLSVPAATGVIYQWFSTTLGAIPGATGNSYTATTSAGYWVEINNTTTFCTGTSNTYVVTATTTPAPVITPAAPTTICTGTNLTLSTATGTGFTFQWSDAGTPIAGATNNTYLVPAVAAGTYSITVNVVNGLCSSTSAARTVTVNLAPTATTVTPAGPVAFCSGGSITLTSTTDVGVNYQWYRGAFTVGGATNTTYNATIAGTYTMRVTNTGNSCFATSNGVVVTVNALPNATIAPNGAISLCSGNTQTLTRTLAAGTTYQWYKDFVAIPGATNNTYGATAAGSYKIRVTTTATGCMDSSATAAVITVNPVPTAPATSASGLTTFCAGNNVTLTAGAVPVGTTYQWYRSGSSIGGATAANYVAAISGSYSVVVINSFGCRDTSAPPIVVTVNPLPSNVVGTSGPTTFCTPGSVDLTAAVGAGYTYQWYNTAGPIPGETNNMYTATTSDRDSVVITSGAGCTTTTAAIVVRSITTPAIIYTGSPSFCTGNSILLSINATGAGITYQWKKNTVNIPGANTSSYSANSPGVYTCFVNIVGSCAVTTAPVTVTVFAALTPVVSYDGTNVSTYNFYASYQWYINAGAIPGATTYQTLVYTPGSYRVMVTDTNGCVLLSAEKPVYSVGVNDVNAQSAISIYPNPATTMVHVESATEVNVTISTIEGKTILQSTSKQDINLSSLANGLYMITVYDDKGSRLKVEKLLKQ